MTQELGALLTTLSAAMEWSVVVKATVAALLGLGAARVARKARASVRHALLASTFAVLLALPVAAALLPSVAISLPMSRLEAPTATPSVPRSRAILAPSPSPAAPAQAGRTGGLQGSVREMAMTVWAVGSAALLLSLGLAISRLRRLRRHSLPWVEASALVAQSAARAGIRRPVDVLIHERVSAPLTCGVLRPAILMPPDARDWDEPHLRRAIVHELEHVRRGDWWMHLASRAVCAVYWFHPLVWMAYRQLALDAERACDDAVLEQEESTQYATQLVALARRMAATGAQPTLAMANRSDLAARISAVLDAGQARGRAGYARALLVSAAAIVIVLALSPIRIVGAATTSGRTDAEGAEQRRGRVAWLDRALVEAASNGDTREVASVLDAGANINAAVHGDGSALIIAAREGKVALVTMLLDRGAEPNLGVPGDGNPLIMAAREGHLGVVELLLDRGASIDQVVDGDENALIQASGGGHLDVVTRLVARGADVNARVWADQAYEPARGEWRTPLTMARRGKHRDVVSFLLSVGAVE